MGNYDHTNNDQQKSHTAGLQIEACELVGDINYTPHINVFQCQRAGEFHPGQSAHRLAQGSATERQHR